jgi:cell division protein FtsZ
MEEFEIEVTREIPQPEGTKIVVVGVGGAGGNMLNTLAEKEIAEQLKLVAANTDVQALETVSADTKVVLGPNTTKGKGAGMDPELGRKAALESYQEIKEALKG